MKGTDVGRNVNVESILTDAMFDDGGDNKCLHVDRLNVNQLDPVETIVVSSKCYYGPTIRDSIVVFQQTFKRDDAIEITNGRCVMID